MTPIQFGFTMPIDRVDAIQRDTHVDNLHRALNLIEGHFDSIWVIDHLANMLESFTTLSYMAGLHPQFKIGHVVVCQSFRNPALLANMGATLQFLSGGRFQLGIGAGGDGEEHEAYGYDFPSGSVRVQQLQETIQIIRAMWTQPRATFVGQHYRIIEVACEPRPEPPPAIMVGGTGPKMLRLTAKYADEWNVASIGLAKYRRLATEFERACTEVGRDPSTVRRSWCGGCCCAPTQAEAEGFAGERYNTHEEDDFDFVGTPRQLVEQMHSFVDLGVSTFMVDCGGFPNLTTLEMHINEVVPALNR